MPVGFCNLCMAVSVFTHKIISANVMKRNVCADPPLVQSYIGGRKTKNNDKTTGVPIQLFHVQE